MAKRRTNKQQPPEVPYIAEGLRPLAVPIGKVKANPRNVRLHAEADIEGTAASLREFGQRKPIVAHRKTRLVLAGNARLEAAKRLGWEHVAVVWVADDPSGAEAYAIADNRTAELADWDAELLAQLVAEIADERPRLIGALELRDMLTAPASGDDGPEADSAADQAVPPTYEVIVGCDGPEDQDHLIEQLRAEGVTCRRLLL